METRTSRPLSIQRQNYIRASGKGLSLLATAWVGISIPLYTNLADISAKQRNVSSDSNGFWYASSSFLFQATQPAPTSRYIELNDNDAWVYQLLISLSVSFTIKHLESFFQDYSIKDKKQDVLKLGSTVLGFALTSFLSVAVSQACKPDELDEKINEGACGAVVLHNALSLPNNLFISSLIFSLFGLGEDYIRRLMSLADYFATQILLPPYLLGTLMESASSCFRKK